MTTRRTLLTLVVSLLLTSMTAIASPFVQPSSPSRSGYKATPPDRRTVGAYQALQPAEPLLALIEPVDGAPLAWRETAPGKFMFKVKVRARNQSNGVPVECCDFQINSTTNDTYNIKASQTNRIAQGAYTLYEYQLDFQLAQSLGTPRNYTLTVQPLNSNKLVGIDKPDTQQKLALVASLQVRSSFKAYQEQVIGARLAFVQPQANHGFPQLVPIKVALIAHSSGHEINWNQLKANGYQPFLGYALQLRTKPNGSNAPWSSNYDAVMIPIETYLAGTSYDFGKSCQAVQMRVTQVSTNPAYDRLVVDPTPWIEVGVYGGCPKP